MTVEIDDRSWNDWGKYTFRSWVKKYLFPDFSKRLTKIVVAAGIACIATPDALQFIVVDWLVRTFSLSQKGSLTLADFQANNADYWAGLGLVAVALVHNLIYKSLESKDIQAKADLDQRKRTADLALFEELCELLPSTSATIRLLKEHDFHNSFRLESVRPLETFIDEWDIPEKTFHDAELNELLLDLLAKSKLFDGYLSSKSGPQGLDRQAVIPDRCRDDWDLPADIQQDVDDLNKAATETFTAHQELLKLGKEKLGC